MAWIQAPSWPAEIGEHADHAEAVALMSIDLPMDMDRLQDPWDHEPAEPLEKQEKIPLEGRRAFDIELVRKE